MSPVLLHVYGPFNINAYGACIAIGLAMAVWLGLRDRLAALLLRDNRLQAIVLIGVISSVVGGRLFYVLTNLSEFSTWRDVFAVWDGGMSVSGAYILGPLCLGLYLYFAQVPVRQTFDLIGVYVPLVQGWGRIGCLWAGCCCGVVTTSSWSIVYENPLSLAPLGVPLCPVQLYMALATFSLWLVLWLCSPFIRVPGVTFCLSMAGIALIRFVTDFWRWERDSCWALGSTSFSVHQLVSLAIVLVSGLLIFLLVRYHRPRRFRRAH
jgi:phosphatidylglycerol:prolipoprotein diacylglycerol transferase